jgi:erythromycin esterase
MRSYFVVWCFLPVMLVACAGSKAVPTASEANAGRHAIAAATATPAPTPTPSGLYTDAELRTDADPRAPDVGTAYETWIAAHAVPVRSETYAGDFSDLEPFGKIVGDKRIVGLGESSHGVGDYSSLKIRLIKYLHEKRGFNVIAFESEMFDDYVVNRKLKTADPTLVMRKCCFYLWWSSEFLDLFRYLKAEAATNHPLILAGFDIQEGGNPKREAAFRAVISPLDAPYAVAAARQDKQYLKLINTAIVKPTKANLSALKAAEPEMATFYTGLADWMARHMRELVAASKSDPHLPGLMRQVAVGSPAYADEIYLAYTSPNTPATDVARDAAMAADVSYLANSLYKGEKIILWSHNAHLAREEGFVNMGSQIASEFGSQYYATGLLPYRGSGNLIPGPRFVYQEPRPPAASIDAILYYSRWRWAYVDMTRQPADAGNAWMSGSPLAYEFYGSYDSPGYRQPALYNYYDPPTVPNELFDGVMYVDTIHPPHYLFPSGDAELRAGLRY